MANKRVIDLPDLSQEVQEGQYVLVDSVGGTGKMDLKHIVDEAGSFDPAGEYPELYAGNLTTDKAQTDKTPYLFRKTGGTLSGIGERCYDTIVGASVGENQLVQSGATSVTVQSGHKYYAKIDGSEILGTSTGSAITINNSSKDMVIDLSLYLPTNIVDYIYSLESATAGSGIAKLRSWGFLKGYQAYNSGSLESVEVTGKVVRGFNQWDEEWEVGGIRTADGTTVSSNAVRSTNYNAMIGGATYYTKSPSDMGVYVFFYGADYGYISYAQTLNNAFVVPLNAKYFKIQVTGAYGTTYNNDICINLSSDRNGEYEPYTAQEYDYGDDTLNGIFKLDANNNLYADGDVKTSDGTITRRYDTIVINGESDITAGTSGMPFKVRIEGKKRLTATTDSPNGVSDKLVGVTQASTWGAPYTFAFTNNTDYIFFKLADSIATIEDAKTWLASNPITVVYELATPTTEQGDPFTSPQVCYPDGTEEFITENGVPVGHSTDYPYSIKALAEELIDIPDVPTASGTYVLKATRSASGITYAWVAG